MDEQSASRAASVPLELHSAYIAGFDAGIVAYRSSQTNTACGGSSAAGKFHGVGLPVASVWDLAVRGQWEKVLALMRETPGLAAADLGGDVRVLHLACGWIAPAHVVEALVVSL
jgi:hypothetical protein